MTVIQDWHIPLHETTLTLAAALTTTHELVRSSPSMLLSWVNDLQHHQPGMPLATTALDQQQRDCIHIVLGRGLLKTDDVFITGFTLASANKGTLVEQSLNAWISRNRQSQLAALDAQELAIFKDAIKLAYISGCAALDRFEFNDWLDQPLGALRDAIGLEHELLAAYYAVEQRRYPHNKASARLVPASKQVVAF